MEFPSLPKFLTSRHRYGRLYDTPLPARPSSSLPHPSALSKSLIHKLKHIWKSSDEKFFTVCRVSGNVESLEKILRKRKRSRDLGDDHILIDGLHIVTYFGHGETVKYFLDELRVPIDAVTKVRKRNGMARTHAPVP
jgi:hypothetical protein